jgi:hypothetical protein
MTHATTQVSGKSFSNENLKLHTKNKIFLERFKQTGQNMAYLSDWGKYGDAKPTVEKFMKMWFQEYKTADMNIISSFRFSDE